MGKTQMKVLVLGSSGYIGNYLCKELAAEGIVVYGYDLVKAPNIGSVAGFVLGDVADGECLENTLTKFNPEVIIDLAANAVVGDGYCLEDYKVNFTTPGILRNALDRSNNESVRSIIFTSTQYVIGPSFFSKFKLAYSPHTVYGQSKVLYEQEIFNHFNSKGNVDFYIIRPTNVWGAAHPKYSQVFEPLLRKGLVAIPRRSPIKSYSHITSLCRLYIDLAKNRPQITLLEDKILYGTDEKITQTDWVKLQVEAFKEVDISASFMTVPEPMLRLVSFALNLLSKLFRINNPLPSSRVDSMTEDYKVLYDRPRGTKQVASIEQQRDFCKRDFIQRFR